MWNKNSKEEFYISEIENNRKVRTLSPKIDVVFQALFGSVGSEKITKKFLESILEEKIEEIDLDKNPILKQEFKDDKLGILDIIAELNGEENCNIEMQVVNKKNMIERILFYWSKLYSKSIKPGEKYDKLKRTIVILIADFKIEKLETLGYHSKWKIIEENERKVILTNKLEIDILELPKIKGKEDKKDELLDWLYFLENPESKRVEEKMKENEELKEAKEKLRGLSEDEKMQRIAELRVKAIMDEDATYRKGIEDGIAKGIEKEKIEMVKKMLKKEMPIEVIMEVTELTKKEIEAITNKT